jgi:hypothetical protein
MPTFTGGLGGQLMLATETTYATPVTPNRTFEFKEGETFALARPKLASAQIAAGRAYQSSSRTIPTTRAGAGAVSMEVPNQGFGTLLNLLHGEAVTPVKEGATNIYKQVHNIGTTDSFKKSATVQFGKPTVEGVVSPYTYPGAVLLGVDFSVAVDAWLMAALTFDTNDELTATALATAAYPTALEGFSFLTCKASINGVEQKLARSLSFKLDTPKDTSRYYLGAEKKAAPLKNALDAGSGTITVDYKDTTLYKIFEEGKTVPIEITFVGATVEAIVTELKFKFEACKLEGDSPNIASLGELQQQIPFKIEDNRTNPPAVVTYVSKDKEL